MRPKPSKVGPRSRQRFPVEPWRFREARLSVGLGVERCADLLRVSPRTVRTWEAGTSRVPYAAYKLLRVMRGGKLLGDEWKGFHVWRDTLITPEGHKFEAGQLGWWSLQVRMAREWQRDQARRTELAARQPVSLSPACGLAPTPERFGASEASPNRTGAGAGLGLSRDSACQSAVSIDVPVAPGQRPQVSSPYPEQGRQRPADEDQRASSGAVPFLRSTGNPGSVACSKPTRPMSGSGSRKGTPPKATNVHRWNQGQATRGASRCLTPELCLKNGDPYPPDLTDDGKQAEFFEDAGQAVQS